MTILAQYLTDTASTSEQSISTFVARSNEGAKSVSHLFFLVNKFTEFKRKILSELQLKEWGTELDSLVRQKLLHPELSVSWLARAVHLSERQLNRRSKTLLGVTAGQYIQQLKLEYAYKIFSQPEPPTVRWVATQLNFFDTKYFSRLFHKRFGVYPSHVSPSPKN